METIIKVDSDLLAKAKMLFNNKSEKVIAEEALRNYILLNNIFNKAAFGQSNFDLGTSNLEIMDEYFKLIAYNQMHIKTISKDIDLTKLAKEVNNEVF